MDNDPDASADSRRDSGPRARDQPRVEAWKVPAGGSERDGKGAAKASDRQRKPPAPDLRTGPSRPPFAPVESSQAPCSTHAPVLTERARAGRSRADASRPASSQARASLNGSQGGGPARAGVLLSKSRDTEVSPPEFDMLRRQSDEELWKLLSEHRRALAQTRRELMDARSEAREKESELKAAQAEVERLRRLSELAVKQVQEAARLKRIAVLELEQERLLRQKTVENARETVAKARRRYYQV